MLQEQIKILEEIAKASDDVKLENLLNGFIHDASFDDVTQIRAMINDRLAWEMTQLAAHNYRKALELLD
jgi:hypothetical protein